MGSGRRLAGRGFPPPEPGRFARCHVWLRASGLKASTSAGRGGGAARPGSAGYRGARCRSGNSGCLGRKNFFVFFGDCRRRQVASQVLSLSSSCFCRLASSSAGSLGSAGIRAGRWGSRSSAGGRAAVAAAAGYRAASRGLPPAAAPQRAAYQRKQQNGGSGKLPPGYYPPPARLRAQVLVFEALPQLAPGRRGVAAQPVLEGGIRGVGISLGQCQTRPQVGGGRRGVAVELLAEEVVDIIGKHSG